MHENPHKAVTVGLLVLIVGGYALMAARFPMAYIWATYEDLVGEWAQTFFFFAASILAFFVAAQKTRYRWFFTVLAVAGCYVVLEEISWGQRIFGFATPEFLKSRNLQGEANLHNLFTGPHKTLLKDLISVVMAVGIAGYGFAYPLALARSWQIAKWLDKLGVAAPPLILWPFFTLAAFFELKPLSFNEAELAELLIGLALAITALHYLVGIKRGLALPLITWGRNESLVLGRWVILMSSAVVLIAGATTVGFYSVPSNQKRVDNRIENGVEKFARRYERYNRCDIANKLYNKLLLREPERVFIIRKVAACHQRMGNADLFAANVQKAIDIDLRIYAEDPWRASVNQSLVRSYRLAGNEEMATRHLAEAIEIGVTRITSKPDSASAAYSYGRTLHLAGRREEAFDQFKRAYDIDRTSSRYRKAYFAARAALE